jgi:hypothetical protein
LPVEFLSDQQAAAYSRLPESLSRAELERYFFLDDVDRGLLETKRRDHNKLGFSLQLVTVRNVGAFLDDPLDVPVELVDYLAEQLGIADASCVKSYGEREKTRFEHVWELRQSGGWREFSAVEAELGEWIEARAWTTGDGPKALFDAAVAWLRERRVLLPGVTTLVRLVASRREVATQRLWETLHKLLDDEQRGLFNTRYLDAAIGELRAGGYAVRDEDAARLSPFVRHHVNVYLDVFLRESGVNSDRQALVRCSRRVRSTDRGCGRRPRCAAQLRGASLVRRRPGQAAVRERVGPVGGARTRWW